MALIIGTCGVAGDAVAGADRGRAVAAVACSPRMTGAAGRHLLHIPFGISAVRESPVQLRIDRSRQAG
jgi:hypothetical protein